MLSLVATFIGISIGSLHAHAGSHFCRVSEGLHMVRLRNWVENFPNELSSFQKLQTNLKAWIDQGYHFYSSPEHEMQLGQLQIRKLLEETGILMQLGGALIFDEAKLHQLYVRAASELTLDQQKALESKDEFLEDLKWVFISRDTRKKNVVSMRHYLSDEIYDRVQEVLEKKIKQGQEIKKIALTDPARFDSRLAFSVVSKELVREYRGQLESLLWILKFAPPQSLPAPKYVKAWAHDVMFAMKSEFDSLLKALLASIDSDSQEVYRSPYLDVSKYEYQVEQFLP